jgi:predicted N-formylglutamate amidohydrolase
LDLPAPTSHPPAGAPLLAPDEPPAFTVLEARGCTPALLVCDHASRRIPRALHGLGLPEHATREHIGWDIGAADVVRQLVLLLDVPAVLAGYSRLVIDCNRHLHDPSSIVAQSDGVVVPGNRAVSAAERERRAASLFRPYHGAIEAQLRRIEARGGTPVVIAVHSFTPVMKQFVRPWHCGILWDADDRLARPLIAALRAEPGLVVGDNEPYSGREPAGFTVDWHAGRPGWPHVGIEIRQDLIAHADGVAEWSRRLARVLEPLLADFGLAP